MSIKKIFPVSPTNGLHNRKSHDSLKKDSNKQNLQQQFKETLKVKLNSTPHIEDTIQFSNLKKENENDKNKGRY